jgi:hypothetical protein
MVQKEGFVFVDVGLLGRKACRLVGRYKRFGEIYCLRLLFNYRYSLGLNRNLPRLDQIIRKPLVTQCNRKEIHVSSDSKLFKKCTRVIYTVHIIKQEIIFWLWG